MTQHSLLPPSSADKWMVCTDWLRAVKGLPNKTSIYAQEGTRAHELLELSLRLGVPPEELSYDQDMTDAVGHAVDWLSQYLVANPESKYSIERRLSWGKAFGQSHLSGTSDLAVVNSEELTVVDYKHGIGVAVDPATSKQLRIYLLGLILDEGPREKYSLVIIQPRARHADGPVRTYSVTPKEITTFEKEARRAAKINLQEKGERKAGDHCKFCLAAGTCRTLATYSLGLAVKEFDDGGPD